MEIHLVCLEALPTVEILQLEFVIEIGLMCIKMNVNFYLRSNICFFDVNC